MAKKQLTVKQKKNRYRSLQYTTFAGEFVSILAPFIVMGAVNAEDWFYQEEGWRVGLGGTLVLALMGIAVFMLTKKKEDEKITNGYVTFIVGWFAVAFIFMLLANIMEQITAIMMFGGVGLLGAFGLDIASQSFKKKADAYKAAIVKVDQESLEDQVRREISEEVNKKVERKRR